MASYKRYQESFYRDLVRQHSSHPEGTLGVDDILCLFEDLRAEITTNQACCIIQRFDSSRSGTLDFHDALEMLEIYEQFINEQKKIGLASYEKFKEKLPQLTGLTRDDLEDLLRLGDHGLTEIEVDRILNDLFPLGNSVVDQNDFEFKGRGAWCQEIEAPDEVETSLNKCAGIRIEEVRGVTGFLRDRKRGNRRIDFKCVDLSVQVRAVGTCRSTQLRSYYKTDALFGEEIFINFNLPSGVISEVEEWSANQTVVFDVFDTVLSGVVPSSEWIGTASIPLNLLLSIKDDPVSLTLFLTIPGLDLPIRNSERPSILISLRVLSETFVDPLSIVDFFRGPEQLKYSSKPEQICLDLENFYENIPDISERYTNFLKFQEDSFPRRSSCVIQMDECEVYRLLPSFIVPLSARVDMTERALCDLLAQMDTLPSQPPVTQSPSTTLLCRSGGALDKAVFLCSCFLGQGLEAYVCFGRNGIGDYTYWVLTINRAVAKFISPPPEHDYETELLPLFGKGVSLYANLDDPDSYSKMAFHPEGIIHWDVARGVRLENEFDRSFPFVELFMVANHKNLWFNTQASTIPDRISYDTQDQNLWKPFLPLNVCIPTVASTLPPSLYWPVSSPDSNNETVKGLVKAIGKRILQYRRRYLFVLDTRFHRPTCQAIQKQISAFEKLGNVWKRSVSSILHGVVDVDDAIPPHCTFYGRPFRFGSTNPDVVMKGIASSGILDSTVPRTAYAYGVHLVEHGFGLVSLWVYIGYVQNLFETM